jgi:hypothetical protein
MVYSYANIINIGEAGLEYVDEYGDVRFVNFEACGENAARHRQDPVARVHVGRRLIAINPRGDIRRTVEFFTSSPTIFEVDSDVQFRGLRFRVEQVGWRII